MKKLLILIGILALLFIALTYGFGYYVFHGRIG